MINKIKIDLYKKLNKYPKRLRHCIEVSLIAQNLAIKYNVNINDAYIAGLFHDYAKYEDQNFYNKYISEKDLIKYKNEKVAYHAISAANYLLENYNINKDIYNAIRNHVFGRKNMSDLEKIIYISDSIYINGPKNNKKLYKKALNNLDEALIEAFSNTLKSLEKRNLTPNKDQIEAYNYYKEVLDEKNT